MLILTTLNNFKPSGEVEPAEMVELSSQQVEAEAIISKKREEQALKRRLEEQRRKLEESESLKTAAEIKKRRDKEDVQIQKALQLNRFRKEEERKRVAEETKAAEAREKANYDAEMKRINQLRTIREMVAKKEQKLEAERKERKNEFIKIKEDHFSRLGSKSPSVPLQGICSPSPQICKPTSNSPLLILKPEVESSQPKPSVDPSYDIQLTSEPRSPNFVSLQELAPSEDYELELLKSDTSIQARTISSCSIPIPAQSSQIINPVAAAISPKASRKSPEPRTPSFDPAFPDILNAGQNFTSSSCTDIIYPVKTELSADNIKHDNLDMSQEKVIFNHQVNEIKRDEVATKESTQVEEEVDVLITIEKDKGLSSSEKQKELPSASERAIIENRYARKPKEIIYNNTKEPKQDGVSMRWQDVKTGMVKDKANSFLIPDINQNYQGMIKTAL